MKAIRVHRFGAPEVMAYEDVARPMPGSDEVLVRVAAAAVGPWDAWIRAGRSACGFCSGAEVYGVTNPRFTGGYAQFALVKATMLAPKPATINFVEAASFPVIAETAWQMLFDYAKIQPGQRVLILGASGSVGSIAVQLAHQHQSYVIAASSSDDAQRVMRLGAAHVVDFRDGTAIAALPPVGAVIDTRGGAMQRRAIALLRPGGYVVSCVSPPDSVLLKDRGLNGTFFLVRPTTRGLGQIAEFVDRGALQCRVGAVMPLSEAQIAHQMLDGLKPYVPGKIVLTVDRDAP